MMPCCHVYDGCLLYGMFAAFCVSSGLLAVATTASFTDSDDGTTFDGCGVRDSTAYYYPNEDTTQYLYETFPEVRWPTMALRRSMSGSP